MRYSKSKLSLCLAAVFAFFTSFSAIADTTLLNAQGKPIIITAVPEPKEVVEVPAGYVNCFMVPAGWNYMGVWVAEHKVCQYTPTSGGAIQGVAWVDGYWACTEMNPGSEPTKANCTNWQWQAGHWVKSLEVY